MIFSDVSLSKEVDRLLADTIGPKSFCQIYLNIFPLSSGVDRLLDTRVSFTVLRTFWTQIFNYISLIK